MTALMEAVATATAVVPRLYAVGSVPREPTYPYGVYSALLGGGTAYTLDSKATVRRGLVSTQSFGKTTDSATAHMELVVQALLDARLSLSGYEVTPMRAALDTPSLNRDPDDNGVVTVALPFTFTASKETP